MKIKAILFDMDGTLIDTEPINKMAWEKTLRNNGFFFDNDFFFKCIGLNEASMEELYKRLYGEYCPFMKLYPEAHRIADEYVEDNGLTVKKGFDEIMGYLENNNIKRILVTSSQRSVVEKRLGKCDLLKHFNGLVCGDEVTRGKPDAEPYLKAIELSGMAKDECLAVEDSTNGVKSACGAQVRCIYIRDLVDIPPEVEKLAYRRVDSLDGIISLLK